MRLRFCLEVGVVGRLLIKQRSSNAKTSNNEVNCLPENVDIPQKVSISQLYVNHYNGGEVNISLFNSVFTRLNAWFDGCWGIMP